MKSGPHPPNSLLPLPQAKGEKLTPLSRRNGRGVGGEGRSVRAVLERGNHANLIDLTQLYRPWLLGQAGCAGAAGRAGGRHARGLARLFAPPTVGSAERARRALEAVSPQGQLAGAVVPLSLRPAPA